MTCRYGCCSSHDKRPQQSESSNEDYNGTDNVLVGNGQGLQIAKIDSTQLSTPTSSFTLNNVLLVPEIQKNLLSVHQFCIDNCMYFEFHDHFFFVKDYSGKVHH